MRIALLILLLLAGLFLAMHLAGRQAERQALRDEAEQAREQLSLYAGSLRTLIDRFRALPAVLALDPEIRSILQGPVDNHLQHQLNLKLETMNRAAGSTTLELLDRDGLAVAASNWRSPTSYVGHNYGFRPYFSEARSHGSGRFYGVGVVSGIPGYFLASAVRGANDEFIGTLVVKLEFPELEQEWGQRPDIILVSDARGVVFIANHPGWRYRELKPISADDRREMAATRQYDKQPLAPLIHSTLQDFGEGSRLARVDGPGGRADFLWESLPLPSEGWTLHLLRTPQEAASSARTASLAAAGAWLALYFLGLFLHQRWRVARIRQRSREELEQLVEQRTAALRTAQDGLIQAAKLAALGQMSTALAHEINQPLTALQMHLASLRLMLANGQLEQAHKALGRHDELLQRMAALTGHLKTYARKTPGGLRECLELGGVVEKALQLLAPNLRDAQVAISQELSVPAWISGDAIRLEQVLVNLLRNALDAVADVPNPTLWISLRRENAHWLLEVADNGGGIGESALPQVFDPFFTTKPAGAGLGIGLAVSYAIVHELGGTLSAANQGAGAVFTLRLPVDKAREEQP
ncbi:putative two-component histidine kinase [Metapseudomonas resinovorans NBRC 106553]|uniref:histidine kinase n=1 Tax=Metapseudomonas resinovorans NBRC 106553 TaxID=1245471 RepID=S6BQQ9_METRE|nr:putative two-component histidine kinase [Pseudomonas resinovorans NBRC 106553]